MAAIQRIRRALCVCLFLAVFAAVSNAQTGNSSTISGTVVDQSGALVANATVNIHDPVSGYQRSATTDSSGSFSFPNVPFNPYHLTVTAKGFSSYAQDVEVRSSVPVDVKITLSVAGTATTVTVEAAADLIETDSTAHTDIDRTLFDKLPLESPSSSVSSLVTLASPGVAADSNGLFHGLGDHAENSFSVDGQPITDQQSKVFSNQIPVDSIQSLEVIDGAPPAEYGDKTSLVIDVTTRSGEGVTTPHGTVTASYGIVWNVERWFRPGLRRPEMGKLHLCERARQRPISRPARIHCNARQRQRGEHIRSGGLPVVKRGLAPTQSRLHAFLVSKSQFVRSTESSGPRQQCDR